MVQNALDDVGLRDGAEDAQRAPTARAFPPGAPVFSPVEGLYPLTRWTTDRSTWNQVVE
jgi:hypothetical protein